MGKNKFTCVEYDNNDLSKKSRDQTYVVLGITIQREKSFITVSVSVKEERCQTFSGSSNKYIALARKKHQIFGRGVRLNKYRQGKPFKAPIS